MASVSRLLNHRGRNLQRLFISSLAHSFRHVRIYHLARTTGEPEITASFLSSEFKSSRTGVNLWTHIKLQEGISRHHVYILYFRPPYNGRILKGWRKKPSRFPVVFSTNFRWPYLGNCMSDLIENKCAKSSHWALLAHQISSKSLKPFPIYRHRKLGKKRWEKARGFIWPPFTYRKSKRLGVYVVA